MFIEACNDVSLEIPFAYKPYTTNKVPTGMGWFVEASLDLSNSLILRVGI